LWIATAYVDGTDAAQLMHDLYPAGMPVAEASAVVTAIASALDYAHDEGLLHRDVKPANILLSQPNRDGQRHVYLADFGIARQLADANGLTATNLTVGTVAYGAPEQLMGEDIDGRADEYALSATAFHLLTGSPPFQNSNPVAVISQHLTVTPPRLSDCRPELVSLDEVLGKALEKDPAQRYPNCTEFARDVARRAIRASSAATQATQAALRGPSLAANAPTQVAHIPAPEPSEPSGSQPLHQGDSRSHRRGASFLVGIAAVSVLIGAGVWAVPRLAGDHQKIGPNATSSPSTPASVGLSAPTSGSATAQEAAESIRAAIPEVTELIPLTEGNDANNLIGRPNGYVEATVIVDSRASRIPLCSSADAGVDCGATVEQWPDETAAHKRAEYIQTIQGAMPIAGREWNTVTGDLLLRVTGELKPSVAKAYEAAFTGLHGETIGAGAITPSNTAPAANSKEALEARAHELDILASQGNAAAAYAFYSRRCRNIIGDLEEYKAFLASWLDGRQPQYTGVTSKVNGSSAQVVSMDNDPSAPVSTMNPRTWTFIDSDWQFDNC
jgi:serine/threonine-protein kinase